MKKGIRNFILAAAAVIMAVSFADARWWIFGKKSAKPEITNVYIAGINLEDAGQVLLLNRDSLRPDGKVEIKGYASGGNGRIAAARISLDGGKTWEKARISKKNTFVWEFRPRPGKTYKPLFEVINEVGAKSDPDDLPRVEVKFKDAGARELVRETLNAIVKAYESENLPAFMKLVSKRFKGDESALEEAVLKDFRTYSAIKLGLTVQNLKIRKNRAKATIRFNWRGRDDKTGRIVKTPTDTTLFGFILEGENYKLYYMKSPVIFGVSNQDDLSSGDNSAESHDSLSYFTGITLRYLGGDASEGFVFDTGEIIEIGTTSSPADVWNAGTYLNSYLHVDMGKVPLSSVTEAPATGYQNESAWDLPYAENLVGHTICVKTRSGKYAKIYVSSYSNETWTFNYVYQPNGSRQF